MSDYSIHPTILHSLNHLPGIKPEEKARAIACVMAYTEPRKTWEYLPYLMGRVTNMFYSLFNSSNWNVAQDALERHMIRYALERLESKFPTPKAQLYTMSNGKTISFAHVKMLKQINPVMKDIAYRSLETYVFTQNKWPTFSKKDERNMASKMNYIPLLRDGIDTYIKAIKAKKH